jgi:hypothetical protein
LITSNELKIALKSEDKLALYVPGKISIKRLPLNFIFTLIKRILPDMYKKMKDKGKKLEK